MNRIAYVTNIELSEVSGGFSAMNRAMFDVLSRDNRVDYVGPISPAPIRWQHWISKARRMLQMGGDFFYFSKRRLDTIRVMVDQQLNHSSADLAVFHGFTPWIHVQPKQPYVAWSDCCFRQYVQIYHDERQFRANDLQRISDSEAKWLRGAERVLFRNQWAADETTAEYGLDPKRVAVVGNYGFMPPPSTDTYQGSADFLFITTDFVKKGGDVAIRAFEKLRQRHSHSRFIVFGSRPPPQLLRIPGVIYKGWIKKSDPAQQKTLADAYANARGLVHPTTADTNPMVVIEAGYFGCPAISTRRFAIPELIVDGVTGRLVDDPRSVEEVYQAMTAFLDDEASYQAMRASVRERMLTNYTKEIFERKLAGEIQFVLDKLRNE